jgi:formylglycine-generating enzyme required for sulfatase activity
VVTDATPEHAVGVRSYYLDRYEWTVGRYRAAVANGFSFREVPLPPQNPGPFFDGRPGPDCVYTDAPSPTDPLQNDRPLTCVSIELADALCHFAGGALPTEAQWEWAAGSREREWFYPWGDDDPPCGAVVDFTGAFRGMGDPPPSCDPMGGARIVGEPVGSHPYDQTSDGVFDMSGNVSEWVIDPFETYDGGCWDPHRNARVDPRCAPQSGDRVLGDTIRGGSFRGTSTLGFHATNRQSVAPQDVGHTLGFRCARTS